MRKGLVILILASALLLSVVESKKQLRKQNPEKTHEEPMMVGTGIKISTSGQNIPTYYTKANTACHAECESYFGNSLLYYPYSRYLCCDLGLGDYSQGWYIMSCYPLTLDCKGD